MADPIFDAAAAVDAAANAAPRRGRRPQDEAYKAQELGLDDDVCSGVLVDQALGFTTHKMDAGYAPLQIDRAALEAAMLRLGLDGNVQAAYGRVFGEQGCLAQSARQHCAARLADANFKRHALRYLRCFVPHAGFAIVPCLRYKINGRCGAKIVTSRYW
jgi:hypothetical protein